ncbi:MAG: hypothetical protein R3C44_18565 [Chloroflexota bacterium]
MSEEADNIPFALQKQGNLMTRWEEARQSLFGSPGSLRGDQSQLRFGNAELPAPIRQAVMDTPNSDRLTILESLTAVRRQTAIDGEEGNYGVPSEGSLRSMRVVLRNTPFEAHLLSDQMLNDDQLGLLAAAVMAFRRAGTGRNRGHGRLIGRPAGCGETLAARHGYQHFITEAFS